MHQKNFYISRLIAAFLSGTIDAEELKELNRWREESTHNELLFQKICDSKNRDGHVAPSAVFNKKKGVNIILSRTILKRKQALFIRIMKYASVVIIPLIIISCLIALYNSSSTNELLSESNNVVKEIKPGESKAILTFENGEQIELQKDTEQTIADKNGTTIHINKTGLEYNQDTKTAPSEKETYNKIEIPRGGEYQLTLSDQSKVHLNTMSSLRFPIQFKNNKRVVELEGEAFFEVTPNSKPFIVKIKGMEIEVLGTSFNISAYSGENARTTLVNGTVKVIPENGSNERVLRPAEQAIFNYSSEEFEVKTVDVALYTSWINGKIYFKDQRLEDIMGALSRWYDMEVVYENSSTKEIRFGCNLNRYENITPFINLLEKTGKVRIKTQGKKIIIY